MMHRASSHSKDDFDDQSKPRILRKKRKMPVNEPSPASPDQSNSDVSMLSDESSLVMMRSSTLPELAWASSESVWDGMVLKDEKYCVRSPDIFARHPELQPRMRSILLDWLIEVCEVYLLHRETFYLAQDYIDRFLYKKRNIPKNQLQLVGVSSLFIAAKVEEIYPPKLAEFAYVTDGACTEKEIEQMELVILTSLNWLVSPVTINSWLNVYLQVAVCQKVGNSDVESRGFSGHAFEEICQLLDLCILDHNCLKFNYGILAASAIAHLLSKETAISSSGFCWVDIVECFHWMLPFAEVINNQGVLEPKFFKKVPSCDRHNIQTHTVGLKMLEQVHFKQAHCTTDKSPSSAKLGVMTPPHSAKKICLKDDVVVP